MILCLIPQAILLAQGLPSAPLDTPAETVAAVASELAPQAQDEPQAAVPAPPADNAAAAPVDATPAPPSALDGAADDGIVVTARQRSPGDPLERVNVKAFEATQTFDHDITAPLAHGYERAVPKPVRRAVHNFLSNLHQPVIFVNFLLQHNIGKAGQTLGRFALNTTIGIAGFIDIAKRKPFHLQQLRNGFADTLGFYGVKAGPFLFLPLIGPTTVRDLAGNLLDRLVPFMGWKPVSGPAWTVPAGALHTFDRRLAMDDELAKVRASADPYTTAREYYLARRKTEIDALHGKLPSGLDAPSAIAAKE